MLTATEWNRVTQFSEKPAVPDTLPGRPDSILASMGIYVFNTRLLEKLLIEDAADSNSSHDFGKDILPKAIGNNLQVFAYPFQDVKTRAQSYWRDVGTVDAYYDANLELVHVKPELNIYDQDWPIWTYQVQQPPAKFVLDEEGRRGMAINSVVSGGCIISGRRRPLVAAVLRRPRGRALQHQSLGHPAARRDRDQSASSKERSSMRAAKIPNGMKIGVDREADAKRFHVTEKGVVLVTPDMLRSLQTQQQ